MKPKQLEQTSIATLELYDRLLTATAQDLTHFREQIEFGFKEDKISTSYYNAKIKVCEEALEKINSHLDNIEKEMRRRLKKLFPNVISFRQLEALGKSLHEEAERYTSLDSTNKPIEIPLKAPDFQKISREIKHGPK